MTPLDRAIEEALAKLHHAPGEEQHDQTAYIGAFTRSAQAKARSVLDALADKTSRFANRRPIFVSVGGGDGEELATLLQSSNATHGVLVEYSSALAGLARVKAESLPEGKTFEVLEGDAQEKIGDAMRYASQMVLAGNGDFIAVTCHAVIHELFDRGRTGSYGSRDFDALGFFATIFSIEDIDTWFTYREPGVPEKWPRTVLVGTACHPRSLLRLVEAICAWHPQLHTLEPAPVIVGDHVRVHRILGMELLAKLFYLPTLSYEIQERYTAVSHTELINMLWLAIGETAKRNSRANIVTRSAPTDSFLQQWHALGVTVIGVNADSSQVQLGIAESQTRVTAWRLADEEARDQPEAPSQRTEPVDLALASEALASRDDDLLCAILASRARAWIESGDAGQALSLLEQVTRTYPEEHFACLISHHALALARRFSGDSAPSSSFFARLEERAQAAGLALLFRAQRMEASRRSGSLEEATTLANSLVRSLDVDISGLAEGMKRYVRGVTHLLIGSLLRQGGRYSVAQQHIDTARSTLQPQIPSHDTEIAHCYYGRAICVAMTGVPDVELSSAIAEAYRSRMFASALINLTFSHAAWFVDDLRRAKDHAAAAAERLSALGYAAYAARGRDLVAALDWWEGLKRGREPEFKGATSDLARCVAYLTGLDRTDEWFAEYARTLRPSRLLGLLQFAKERPAVFGKPLSLILPSTIAIAEDENLQWRRGQRVCSLEEADAALRNLLGIPLDRRLPLLAD